MMKYLTVSFFGHRQVLDRRRVEEDLKRVVENLINKGAKTFKVGAHGEFDNIAFYVCKKFLDKNSLINIDLVKSSIRQVIRKEEFGFVENSEASIKIVTYPIEEVYFKNQIITTNKFMVDDSDVIVCYVDMERRNSGAKKIVNYAKKQRKQIINIFEKVVDEDFNKLRTEEKMAKIREFLKK